MLTQAQLSALKADLTARGLPDVTYPQDADIAKFYNTVAANEGKGFVSMSIEAFTAEFLNIVQEDGYQLFKQQATQIGIPPIAPDGAALVLFDMMTILKFGSISLAETRVINAINKLLVPGTISPTRKASLLLIGQQDRTPAEKLYNTVGMLLHHKDVTMARRLK